MLDAAFSEAKFFRGRDGKPWLGFKLVSENTGMSICDQLDPEREYVLQIKRKGRSLDANAYAWVLLDKLAQHYGLNAVDIYREEIRMIPGVSDIVCIRRDAVERFCRDWSAKGTGWMADVLPSKIDGCKNVKVWYGSSAYDTQQMFALIDQIVSDCKAVGIETLPPHELARMMEGVR